MEKKNFLLLVLAVILLFFAAGCTQTAQEGQGQVEKATVTLKYSDQNGETILEKGFEVENGTNAFEAMKENVIVDYEMFSMGAFVKSIAGVAAPEGYYLALHVNGAYAEKGISDYTVEEDMLIEWKTESLESFGA